MNDVYRFINDIALQQKRTAMSPGRLLLSTDSSIMSPSTVPSLVSGAATETSPHINKTNVKLTDVPEWDDDDFEASIKENPVKISPVNSVRSNQMSIVSLNDDDVDSSSIADSDSDADHVPSRSEFMAGALANQKSRMEANGLVRSDNVTTGNGIIVINNAGDGLLSASASSRPHIGSIALQNSTDITFGDKKYFQAPVTIKKYYLDKEQWVQRDTVDGSTSAASTSAGTDNLAFVRSNGDLGEYLLIIL